MSRPYTSPEPPVDPVEMAKIIDEEVPSTENGWVKTEVVTLPDGTNVSIAYFDLGEEPAPEA